MTSTFQTSNLMNRSNYRYSFRSSENIYQASVTDFDGDEYDYEVMANTYEEAAAQVEALAYESGIQICNMNIYMVG